MVRSRGKSTETVEKINRDDESEQEQEQDEDGHDEVVSIITDKHRDDADVQQKKWEFSEARKTSLAKAREKAKQLREQLKIANPPKPKEKQPTKMEKQLEQLKRTNEPTKASESDPSPPYEPTPSDVWLRQAQQPAPSASKCVREGKFVYLMD